MQGTSRSEQVKITRELLSGIKMKVRELHILQGMSMFEEDQVSDEKKADLSRITKEAKFSSAIDGLLDELAYFSYLIQISEIEDKNILKYCIPIIDDAFLSIETDLEILKKEGASSFLQGHWDYLNKVKDPIKIWLEKYPSSRSRDLRDFSEEVDKITEEFE